MSPKVHYSSQLLLKVEIMTFYVKIMTFYVITMTETHNCNF